MILLSSLILCVASPTFPESPAQPVPLAITVPSSSNPSNANENIEPIFHSLFDSTIYFGAGTVLGSTTILAGISWSICQLTPWTKSIGDECLIVSQLCGMAAVRSFVQTIKTSPLLACFFKKLPSSHSAWNLHKKMLSQIPAFSKEEKELLDFLQKRWLAKTTGYYPFLIDWMCPSFGISLQVHPETTNSYARDPSNKFSDTYKNRLKAWKQLLPHPQSFPLILTRPANITDYLPSCIEIAKDETIQDAATRVADKMKAAASPIIVDLTSVLPSETLGRKQWLDAWQSYEMLFSKSCQQHQLNLEQILCFHRVMQEDVGGIRLLPLCSSTKENIEEHYQFLLEWISRFGLSANRVELDRSLLSSQASSPKQNLIPPMFVDFRSKEEWVSFLHSIDNSWKSIEPHKTLMFKGTVQVLKDLGAVITQQKWEEIMRSPTRSSIVHLCFARIKQQLQMLVQEDQKVSFYDTASRLEEIHSHLSSLLEIFSPFNSGDFSDAYRHHLASIPQNLQRLAGYSIHSSGMTSLAGIIKATQKNVAKPLRILFGENTYFECIHAIERISNASSIQEAHEQDWKDVDLILAQFNPTVKRINFKVTEYQVSEYHVEEIAKTLHKALNTREGKPLSIALDCTLDFSDSKRVGTLLAEFEKEIERGDLNVMCYRSGIKFDLFGMDNYCGAPFFMVHNQDPKWANFDTLLTDPVLQTDRLSLNWFCLAYQHAVPYLELYRKQIFDNTRAVLNKVPRRLFRTKNVNYRIIPCDSDAEPSFIDIKIFGPLHAIRGGLIVGMLLTLKCMEAGHPLLYRPSIGFYHPNLAVLFGTECTTIRLTLGLDPAQIDVIVHCLEKVDTLNGPIEERAIHSRI